MNANRYNNFFESIISSGTIKELPGWERFHAEVTPKCCDMEGHAQKCVGKNSEAIIYRLHTLRRRPPVQKRRLVGNSGTIQKVCSHTVLKCPYLARIGRPDIAWSLRCLARGITETKLVVNAWPFGSRTFVPIGWSCRKQTAVSLSSSTAEIISLDAGLRYESIPALNLCDLVNVSLNSMISQKNLWNLIGEFVRDKLQSRSIGKCRRCLQRRAYSLRFKGRIIFMPMYNDLYWW